MGNTAFLNIRCNPPKRFAGRVHFIVGIDDEQLGEGYSGDIISIEVPLGRQKVLILVRDGGIDSMSGTTDIEVSEDMNLKVKYALLSKSARLVIDR